MGDANARSAQLRPKGRLIRRQGCVRPIEHLLESSCPEIAAARGIRFDLENACFRKGRNDLRGHGHIRRFFFVLAGHFDFPTAYPGAKQKCGSELGTFRDTDKTKAGTWSGAVDE